MGEVGVALGVDVCSVAVAGKAEPSISPDQCSRGQCQNGRWRQMIDGSSDARGSYGTGIGGGGGVVAVKQ